MFATNPIVFNSESPQTPINFNVNESQKPTYAKIYSRFAAFIVDSLIQAIIIAIISGVIFALSAVLSFPNSQIIFPILSLALTLISILAYEIYFLTTSGATPGKMLVGIKVIKENGELLTIREALIREIIYFLMIFVVIFIQLIPIIGLIVSLILYPLFFNYCIKDPKKQNLYDKIYNNIYFSNNEKPTLSKIIIGCGCTFYISIALGIGIAIGIFITNLMTSPNTSSESVNGILRYIQMINTGKVPTLDTSYNLDSIINQNNNKLENNNSTSQNKNSYSVTESEKTITTNPKDSPLTSPSTGVFNQEILTETIRTNPIYNQCMVSAEGISKDPALLSRYQNYCTCATKDFIQGETDPVKIAEKCLIFLQ